MDASGRNIHSETSKISNSFVSVTFFNAANVASLQCMDHRNAWRPVLPAWHTDPDSDVVRTCESEETAALKF